MALLAAGSLTNVYASLDAYIATHLVDAAGLTVHAHGVRRFVPPTDTPWVQVHYDFLGIQSQFRHSVGGNVLAREPRGYLQLNIYQRARFWATRYTTAAARDLVVGAFPEGCVMLIADYVTAAQNNTLLEDVGALIFDGVQEHVQDSGLESGMTQHIVQVATRYLEQYTR